MLNRRDVLKAGAASVAGGGAGAGLAAQPPGPFELPTAAFDVKKTTELPPWAFRTPLPIPPVPRPTAVGTYEQLTRQGAMPFGPTDPVPVGEVFHGVAAEFGATPDHWRMYGMDPRLTGAGSWKDKQQHFGQFALHDDPQKFVANWGGFPIKCYKVPIVEFEKSLAHHPLPARLYGYAGITPGPMYALRLGQPVLIRYENRLETEVSIHLHGGHSPSHSDGFPLFYVLQGKARDYFYPNILPLKEYRPGADPDDDCPALRKEEEALVRPTPPVTLNGGKRFVVDFGEAQSSMWYHDHANDATGYNVSRGLAGVARCFGERELRLIRAGVLPGLRERSCFDPERDRLETDPVKVADLEDPQQPGYYRYGKEPYHNPYDIYMVLQDRVIDAATGQLAYDSNGHNGYLGDTVLINGEAFPYLDVENRKYRFRFLDGSNARIYRLRILSEKDLAQIQRTGIEAAADPTAPETLAARSRGYDDLAQPFLRIGKDSWLWSKPLLRRSVTIAMANRADIVVDFPALAADLKPGQERSFYLVNTMPQFDGRGPRVPLADGGDPRVLPLPFDTVATADGAVPATTVAELPRPMVLMKFIVRGAPAPKDQDASIGLDTCLNPHDAIRDDEVQVVREFVFQRGAGAWMINKRFYDPTIANATPTLGSVEEWVLRNGGGGWWHPIHIHLESHQLVSYEKDFAADAVVDAADPPVQLPPGPLVQLIDQIPPVEVRGLHDTQILGPNTVARIRMRFRTWNGPFVFHCHNVEHEDMRMMHNFEPVPRQLLLTAEPDEAADRTAANTAPDARTHGDDVTLQPPPGDARRRKVGELPWEPPPPTTPVDHSSPRAVSHARDPNPEA
ncbi:MAG: copper oxidase [Planctomycetia bacterium]|nr:copper oxidase [Planctomycetia bacterium]